MTLPPFVRVTASTEATSRKRRSCKAEDGLIVTNKAWCAKREDGLSAPAEIINSPKERRREMKK